LTFLCDSSYNMHVIVTYSQGGFDVYFCWDTLAKNGPKQMLLENKTTTIFRMIFVKFY